MVVQVKRAKMNFHPVQEVGAVVQPAVVHEDEIEKLWSACTTARTSWTSKILFFSSDTERFGKFELTLPRTNERGEAKFTGPR